MLKLKLTKTYVPDAHAISWLCSKNEQGASCIREDAHFPQRVH